MNKNKLLKTLNLKEEKVLDALEDLQNFLDSTEDEELSSMGNELISNVIDFFQENEYLNIYDIKSFIEEDYESD